MSTRPTKRARASTSTTPITSPPPTDLGPLIASFPKPTLQALLLSAATSHPSVATLVQTTYSRLAAAQRAKVVDFDHLSKDAWKTLNVTYSRLSGSKQYDMSGEAAAAVMGCVRQIVRACPREASAGTKRSAVETLRKIGKTVCLSGDTLGREVRKSFGYETCLQDAMVGILRTMGVEEREGLLRPGAGEEMSWGEKVRELVGLGKECYVFEGLDEAIALLEEGTETAVGEGEGDDEGDDDGSEEETGSESGQSEGEPGAEGTGQELAS